MKPLPGNFRQHLVYWKTADMPLHIVFLGEIAPTSYGTALGAKGNHYIGTSGNVWIPLPEGNPLLKFIAVHKDRGLH